MTDRELLERAAQAAGVPVEGWTDDDWVKTSIDADGTYSIWSSLKSGGDALGLAVKLNMEISVTDGHAWAMAINGTGGGCSEFLKGDPMAAARRAITRAAAAIQAPGATQAAPANPSTSASTS
ncbi:hypothetical protein [Roseateles sp. P5_E11]